MDHSESRLIYLDHNATTPVDKSAAEVMTLFITGEFGNPSSGYSLGITAKNAVENARQEAASLIGCNSSELIFTSGGSESNNMVLKGAVDFSNPGKSHIITSAIEHPAIINPLLYLMEQGAEVTFLPVDSHGMVNPDDVKNAIRRETSLISIMLANNETGTIQPVREISKIAKERAVPVHTDAAQAVGKIPVNVRDLGVDFLSIAGHKLYGPKGVGALFIREGVSITPLIHGAGQEHGRRAGTENVILAAGLGAAAKTAQERMTDEYKRVKGLRDRLQELLLSGIDELVLNGHPEKRLPNTLNVSIPKIDGGKLLEGLDNIAASTGAACHDRSVKLSHVLSAMGVTPETGMGTLRLTLGRLNDLEQIETAAGQIITAANKMRQ